ncbi:hypothetical protein cypCar_00028638 [Cyprinus carpio]|nr:hypothetical protein cypCar_00028638 [Cyprinus carpio]
MSKGAFHNRGKSESLRVAFLDKNKTPNFKQQIRLVFTMEISKTDVQFSVEETEPPLGVSTVRPWNYAEGGGIIRTV